MAIRNAPNALPIIDLTRCDGCGLCMTACPTRALALVDGKANLCHPERCAYCTHCEAACPSQAIACPFTVVFEEAPTTRHS